MSSEPPLLHVLAGGGGVGYRATLRLEPRDAGTLLHFTLKAQVPRPLYGRVEREVQADIERLARLAERDARA